MHLEEDLVARVLLQLHVVSSSSAFSTMVRNLNSRNSRAVQADARLREDGGSAGVMRIAMAMPPINGLKTSRQKRRDASSGRALRESLTLAVAGGLHVDQRKAGDGPGMDARADDVDDARREHEVLATRLERPRDRLTTGRWQFVGARDRDGVGGRRERALPTWPTSPRRGMSVPSTVPTANAPGRQAPTTWYPALGLAPQASPICATDCAEPTRITRALNSPGDAGGQPLPPQPPLDEEHRDAQRQADEQISPGDIHAKEEREDGDDAEETHAHGEDPDVSASRSRSRDSCASR